VLPATPFAHTLGFRPLPVLYFAALAAMVIGYLVLIEVGKRIFYRTATGAANSVAVPAKAITTGSYRRRHRLRRRAAYFSTSDLTAPPSPPRN
jgi:P-type Mg2+ transporter